MKSMLKVEVYVKFSFNICHLYRHLTKRGLYFHQQNTSHRIKKTKALTHPLYLRFLYAI